MASDTQFYSSLNEALDRLRDDIDSVSAVVSNLAPDHFETLNYLLQFGVNKIVCEKPVTNCLSDIEKLLDLEKLHGARITVNIPRRFTKLAESINEISTQKMGGQPTSIVVHGGAKCMVTNGSHWVDLAISIFGDQPEKVVSFSEPKLINPRGKNLEMWGGVSTWWFSGERSFTISFDNASSVESVANIYSRNGRTDCFVDGSAEFFLRNPEEVLSDPRVTRCGGVYKFDQIIQPIASNTILLALRSVEASGPMEFELKDALLSNQATLAALVSAKEKRIVTFPVSKNFRCFADKWNVT